jgi:hypothetical protein
MYEGKGSAFRLIWDQRKFCMWESNKIADKVFAVFWAPTILSLGQSEIEQKYSHQHLNDSSDAIASLSNCQAHVNQSRANDLCIELDRLHRPLSELVFAFATTHKSRLWMKLIFLQDSVSVRNRSLGSRLWQLIFLHTFCVSELNQNFTCLLLVIVQVITWFIVDLTSD